LGYGQEHQLLDWLKQVTFPREKKFESVAYARRTYESVVTRVINSGTTTCCYYGTLHKEATEILASICHKKGQRAFIGKVCMDRNAVPEYQEKSAAISINDTKEFIRHVRSKCCAPTIEPDFLSAQGEFLSEPRSPVSISSHGSSLMVTQAEDTALVKWALRARKATLLTSSRPIATPRFAISCSDTLLASIGALVTRDQSLAIQTHLSENEVSLPCAVAMKLTIEQTEVEFTKELFPFAKNYTAVYDHFGLLRHNTILARTRLTLLAT
jgi:guanine deaminase